jgi:hypothetical protein
MTPSARQFRPVQSDPDRVRDQIAAYDLGGPAALTGSQLDKRVGRALAYVDYLSRWAKITTQVRFELLNKIHTWRQAYNKPKRT